MNNRIIKPEELRLRNRILEDGHEVAVSSIEYTYDQQIFINGNLPERFQVIPITPEWLERMGFEKDDSGVEMSHEDYCEWYEKLFPIIGWLVQSSSKEYLFDEETDTLRIKYVHQLQNLYYALTGTELDIKD